ncbi:ribosomal protein S18-alanine N-acetyltransferase [Desulfogranum marinum]|uniref:ribosomal protein S18-alanine N-acetyltransferase n=1 Tax=Desulfogranum marinum TaxID=453220 RepID=UPI00196561F7|nr:ribosomal protein S18-alanine N-acetyltransferase [Desulfogranum marinum]MBM9513598.1 ribosomal protein S18-alanine N-acetyltransferase [Desulfogranum marinum]
MQPKDLAAVHLIEQEVMETFWSEKQIRSECEYAEGVQLVAEAEGKVCGYVFFRWCGPESELLRIGVAPGKRKIGIGGALVDKGLMLLAKENVEQCWLEVRASNESAQQFYQGKGFLRRGVRPKYYRNPAEAAVLMITKVIKEPGGGL